MKMRKFIMFISAVWAHHPPCLTASFEPVGEELEEEVEEEEEEEGKEQAAVGEAA